MHAHIIAWHGIASVCLYINTYICTVHVESGEGRFCDTSSDSTSAAWIFFTSGSESTVLGGVPYIDPYTLIYT